MKLRFRKISVLILVTLVVVLLLAFHDSTDAATYNFFFNNTEQGNNSTANPTLTIDDQALKNGAAKNADGTPILNSAPGTPNTNGASNAVAQADGEAADGFNRFKVGLEYLMYQTEMSAENFWQYYSKSGAGYANAFEKSKAPGISLEYMPFSHLGVRALFSPKVYGGELAFHPLGLQRARPLGISGLEMDISLLAGYFIYNPGTTGPSRPGSSFGQASGTDASKFGETKFNRAHLGVAIGTRLYKNIDLYASARVLKPLTKDASSSLFYSKLLTSAGVMVRF